MAKVISVASDVDEEYQGIIADIKANFTGELDYSTEFEALNKLLSTIDSTDIDLEEIEINLFLHCWHRCGIIWLPYVTNENKTVPQIKLNVHRDEHDTANMVIWTNKNYDTTGDIEFKDYNIEHYYTSIKCLNIPFNIDIYQDPALQTTVSNPIGWWVTND